MRIAVYVSVVYTVMFGLFFRWPKWWKGNFITWEALATTRQGREMLQSMVDAMPDDMDEESALFGLRFAAALWWPRVLSSGISHRLGLRLRAARVARMRRKHNTILAQRIQVVLREEDDDANV